MGTQPLRRNWNCWMQGTPIHASTSEDELLLGKFLAGPR